jgi:oligosaccharide translocation protein RFT1
MQNDEEKSGASALRQAAAALLSLLAIQCSLTVILLVFGPTYLPIILRIILPKQYLMTSAPKVLAAWLWYIPILAVNGGLEAFFSSVADARDLNKQSRYELSTFCSILPLTRQFRWMAGFSLVYISAALIFYRCGLGDASLVYANMINLSARIAYCWYFISSYFRSRGASSVLMWKDAIPQQEVLVVSAFSKVVIWCSEKMMNIDTELLDIRIALHVLFGAVLGATCLGTWWMFSGRFVIHNVYNKSK